MKDLIRPCVQEKCPNKKQRTQGLIYRTTFMSIVAFAAALVQDQDEQNLQPVI